jgi:hypothetical protein
MHLAIYAATSAAAGGRRYVTILAAGARRWVPRVGAAHRRGLIINRLTCCSKDTSIPAANSSRLYDDRSSASRRL